MAGDIGWLDVAKGTARTMDGEITPVVIKSLADRRVGELTDLIISNFGVHLMQRIA